MFFTKNVTGEGDKKKHGESIADHISYVDAKFGSWQLLPKGATEL